MNQLQIELARKLVAHERWEWKVGMLAIGSCGGMDGSIRLWWPVTRHKGERGPIGIHSGGNTWPISMHGPYLPDLADDATAGVLLGMWREAVKANGDDYEGRSSRAYRASCVGLMRAAFWDQEGQTHMAELFARMLLDAWSAQ
jgi:hypothetical protein